MEDSKDYFIARIVTNEEMQCNGYIDFLCRNMKEQISTGILAIVSDGNEYAIKMLPEQRIKNPDMLSVEIRQGISVQELVRCGECKHGITGHGITDGWVLCSKPYVTDTVGNMMHRCDWFCADGERKQERGIKNV